MNGLTREEIACELAKKTQHFYAESLLIIEEKVEGALKCYHCESKQVTIRYGTAACETLQHCWLRKPGDKINHHSVAIYLKCSDCNEEVHRHIDESILFGVDSDKAAELVQSIP